MNADMPIYAEHNSSIGQRRANNLSAFIYILVFLVSIAPYAQYAAWIIPLFFLFKEKDSELVKYSAAQCLILYFIMNVIHIVLSFIPTVFSVPSSCIVTAFINLPKAPVWSILYILVFLITAVITFVCVRYAVAFSAYRVKFINTFADRLAD